ncbi:MAG: winged helix-turn-helix transcriptional regulator [Candidatus Aenigmarchaeota archaeon]|nr:winged helix-turn-helix transcriptional regulator [Candidatus Aenigmarchaeota archaeon]
MGNNNHKTAEKILKILLKHGYGLTIEEVSKILKINRATASKYLAILEAKELILIREVGKAKLHYVKSREMEKWLK